LCTFNSKVGLETQRHSGFFKVLTRLRHVHKFDGVLLACLFVGRQMDVSEATFADLFADAVLVEDGAVVELLSCTDNINTLEV